MQTTSAVLIRDLVKTYPQPHGLPPVTALDHVHLDVPAGTFTAVVGPSGSGKSTLLHCAAGLDEPTSGSVVLAGAEITAMKPRRRGAHRCAHVGFVFQEYNLVSSLSARDNVELPARLGGRRLPAAHVTEALERVGLADRARLRPHELSGGERQRVAVARVLATAPEVVFADEPTGALDISAGAIVLDWLAALPRQGSTVVMVTHDPRAAARADRVVVMSAGRVADVLPGGDEAAVAAAVLRARQEEVAA
ncbi:ABC transporter ATP-binding protein [Mobilicoccus massiliensis]|uniref:ABC transporter ATP-binding protein n=1 Tax=Mobilicoccus massiliensis TaxID=1522310 RepID=UPI0009E1DFE9|nr:ABC transporter ATP-binding protein [Mobilicoccus massiliensis]